MTPPRIYLAAAALSALALGVAVANGWGQDFPDGDRGDSGLPLSAWSADWPTAESHVEANVQHADVAPR
ncbi:hypothetical protein OTB20_14300 [Streptomyces sp. H27-H1]|uniref:hypothetical protein n=1 Tax=unclassified Streptomyces TaxID=2593676 RepID=UPI00226EFD2B|nr:MULTISPECIES: hypothetical protein [unclassified Streptomyces]MCY0927360.1 hypothetical protein [Streptomyces sp. H27-H1]MCY0939631.1 hypothetical protein [Streptomyces sp. H34-S4]